MRIAMCDDEPIILDELQKFCTACYKRAGISPTWLVSLQRGWYPVILTAL